MMTTASYTPRNTEPGYLRRFYRQLDDVRYEYFDLVLPVETLPFEGDYWRIKRNYGLVAGSLFSPLRHLLGAFMAFFQGAKTSAWCKIIWRVRPSFKSCFRAVDERVYRPVSNAHFALHNESH